MLLHSSIYRHNKPKYFHYKPSCVGTYVYHTHMNTNERLNDDGEKNNNCKMQWNLKIKKLKKKKTNYLLRRLQAGGCYG